MEGGRREGGREGWREGRREGEREGVREEEGGMDSYVHVHVHTIYLVTLSSEDVSVGWVGEIFSTTVHLFRHAGHAWAEVLSERHQLFH